MKLFNFRKEFNKSSFNDFIATSTPIEQFQKWFDDAVKIGETEPNAMTLATCTRDGNPSARIVLLKEFSERGFTFFTYYNSKKGVHLSENAFAALVLYWPKLERQVRIEGRVEKLMVHESDRYFDARPRGSQVSSFISLQSHVLDNRSILERSFEKASADFEGKPIPRPAGWGGYLLKPYLIEFWQGRENRLHDRLEYHSDGHKWSVRRLFP